MAEPNLAPATFAEYNEQIQSLLFSVPPEIRYAIFAYSLASTPGTTQPVGQDAHCTRPGYETRHHTYLKLPSSVTLFEFDIESRVHREDEVDYIARKTADEWHFKRSDGIHLLAGQSDISISRWTGSSVLGNERWVRDETRPGQLDYYLTTIAWRPSQHPLGARPLYNPSLMEPAAACTAGV
ncbi:hypothetical protein NUU61_008360 [Penicillium alfredii]|uniref:Uncharacterized protein n=1 Tax=Penicillium alfredii TaxID=1506179 RepID=A0A9W9ES75_9EURO|nr:uncharacterized protein NUU61_008360 [Penicillium alfredii]KAJ5087053.1 hypothetical protein NUU61_008360 [Penicillium alfredii]